MNSNDILDDSMSLEEKLAAIDAMMTDKSTQEQINKKLGRPFDTPIDPADATICDGCE